MKERLKEWWKYFAVYIDCDRCGKPTKIQDSTMITGGFRLCDRCYKVSVFDRDIPIL